MAFVGDTGQGGTASLSVSGVIGVCYRSIQLPNWTMEKVDASCISTEGFMRYIPADVIDPGDIQLEAIFDAADQDVSSVIGEVQEITITFPKTIETSTAGATLIGTGFVSANQLPSMALNELMVLSLTFSFDGDEGPTYTPETLAV